MERKKSRIRLENSLGIFYYMIDNKNMPLSRIDEGAERLDKEND